MQSKQKLQTKLTDATRKLREAQQGYANAQDELEEMYTDNLMHDRDQDKGCAPIRKRMTQHSEAESDAEETIAALRKAIARVTAELSRKAMDTKAERTVALTEIVDFADAESEVQAAVARLQCYYKLARGISYLDLAPDRMVLRITAGERASEFLAVRNETMRDLEQEIADHVS